MVDGSANLQFWSKAGNFVLRYIRSTEVFDQHDVAIQLVYASEKNPPAIRRHGEPPASREALSSIHGGDLLHLVVREIEEVDLGGSCRFIEEADAILQDPPVAIPDVLIEDTSFPAALNRH